MGASGGTDRSRRRPAAHARPEWVAVRWVEVDGTAARDPPTRNDDERSVPREDHCDPQLGDYYVGVGRARRGRSDPRSWSHGTGRQWATGAPAARGPGASHPSYLDQGKRRTVSTATATRPTAPTTPSLRVRHGRKGRIAVGSDADLVVLDDSHRIREVMARGQFLVRTGEPIAFGTFEGPLARRIR